MTTLQAIADRVTTATAINGRPSIDPLTVIAIIQVLAQAAAMCFPEPEEAARYLNGADYRAKPLRNAIRKRRIDSAIRRELAKQKVSPARHGELSDAIKSECERATADVMADLFADVRAKENI